MKLGDIPFKGDYEVYMWYRNEYNKVHHGCGSCPEEFKDCYVIGLYPDKQGHMIIVEVSAPENPRGMYVVESKSIDQSMTFERHYTRKQSAIRMAAKTANDGYISYYNPEMEPARREYKISCVRVYDMRCPAKDIDF